MTPISSSFVRNPGIVIDAVVLTDPKFVRVWLHLEELLCFTMAYLPVGGDRTLAKRVFDHKTSLAIGSASLTFNFRQSLTLTLIK
ncbi:hypothetical protein [Nostoc sp. 'Peltigera membranacea cyanobiont' N6]|uniref:hypothetical protein n=1 Tax=Nostoc sp. 'Peltigera membranacea cyanobiont' N6 TaxID=1261031 RepID=UPI0015E48918|nr:hypothetical protein [Nostoc sp. 'Peltigera membranacea cyanobiont' N6]